MVGVPSAARAARRQRSRHPTGRQSVYKASCWCGGYFARWVHAFARIDARLAIAEGDSRQHIPDVPSAPPPSLLPNAPAIFPERRCQRRNTKAAPRERRTRARRRRRPGIRNRDGFRLAESGQLTATRVFLPPRGWNPFFAWASAPGLPTSTPAVAEVVFTTNHDCYHEVLHRSVVSRGTDRVMIRAMIGN